jgi:hypothetical protein
MDNIKTHMEDCYLEISLVRVTMWYNSESNYWYILERDLERACREPHIEVVGNTTALEFRVSKYTCKLHRRVRGRLGVCGRHDQ